MTHKFNSGIHNLAVCRKNFVIIVTFALSITYIYWTLADAWVKKDEHLINQKCYMDPSNIFDFLNVRPFSPRGFFTFLVAVAHGVPFHNLFLILMGMKQGE